MGHHSDREAEDTAQTSALVDALAGTIRDTEYRAIKSLNAVSVALRQLQAAIGTLSPLDDAALRIGELANLMKSAGGKPRRSDRAAGTAYSGTDDALEAVAAAAREITLATGLIANKTNIPPPRRTRRIETGRRSGCRADNDQTAAL